MINDALYIRRELMIRLVRAFDADTLADELDHIPIKMRPRDQMPSRCCVYRDRAVLKYRLMALLGIGCEEETDEASTLAAYYRQVQPELPRANNFPAGRENAPEENSAGRVPLSVCAAACSACPPSRVVVTGNCRGCFARPCQSSCPKQAITVVNQVSTIDQAKCVQCGKCVTACPFRAIMKTTVPCEDACPVGAIRKNDRGVAQIDFSKCIYCGKCFAACPFSAILERSQLLDVLWAMRAGRQVIAIIAPAAAAQFPGSLEQLFAAVRRAGFSEVIEVAHGAEQTAAAETAEFAERQRENPGALMTTSCCPAYVELVRKHLPGFLPHVSDTPSPMIYAAQLARKEFPDAEIVFVGPCIAKRVEAAQRGVDYVLSFEELGALLAGRKTDIIAENATPFAAPAADTARGFAYSHGVTAAVQAQAANAGTAAPREPRAIDGIDRKALSQLKLYAAGKLPGDFLEVMACNGGCVNGPGSLRK